MRAFPTASLSLPSEVKTYIAQLEQACLRARDVAHATTEMVEAAGVFVTPLERRRSWNEFKEDASDRLRDTKAAVTQLSQELNNLPLSLEAECLYAASICRTQADKEPYSFYSFTHMFGVRVSEGNYKGAVHLVNSEWDKVRVHPELLQTFAFVQRFL